MSTDPERQRSIDHDANDLRDIKILRETPAFSQYWIRRLKEIRDGLDGQFHEEECDPVKRECYRKQISLCDNLLTMLDREENIATLSLKGKLGSVS